MTTARLTDAERAVLDAAHSVFLTADLRARVDRLGALKQAVERLDLERTAAALQGVGRNRFSDALALIPGMAGARAWNVYSRNFQTPEGLARASVADIRDVRGAGKNVHAAWAAALNHLGLTIEWAELVSDTDYRFYKEALRA